MLGPGGDHHLLPLRIGQPLPQKLRTRLAMCRVTAIRRVIQRPGEIGAPGHADQGVTQPVFQRFAVGLDDGKVEQFGLPQAIGAYVVASVIIAVVGLSGAFDKLMSRLPKAIAAAMLAGILFRFGAELFTSIKLQPTLVLSMIAAYLICKRLSPRYAIVSVLIVGCAVAASFGELNSGSITIAVAHPVFIAPEWSWHAIINIGLPLALVTLTGQYVPGMAVLRTSGYNTPARSIISVTAMGSILMAPFGSHGFNLAAITAAICTGREAHEDRDKRYIAGIACGVFYILMGTFGATLASVFSALPKELIASLAGLALFGAISAGLTGAMADEKQREAALITFLVTASGMSFLGLAAAFWGLIFGLVAHFVLTWTRERNVAAMVAGD